jgi:hypothetical protein
MDKVIRAIRQPLESTVVPAPTGGQCTLINIECGLPTGAGDSMVAGKYPDGDYVIGVVCRGQPGTIVLHPETMRDLLQALFQLVQS